MTWQLEGPIRKGPICLGVVVEQTVSANASATYIFSRGQKHPVLILVLSDGRLKGFDLSGRCLNTADIERCYPTAVAQFRAAVSAQ